MLLVSLAHALDCDIAVLGAVFPPDGSTGAPLNTVVAVEAQDATADDLLLLDGDGLAVDVDLVLAGVSPLDVAELWPQEELAPATEHTVWWMRDDGDGPTQIGSFVTGSGADTEAPAAPTLRSATHTSEPSEWGGDVQTLELDFTPPGSEPLLRYELRVEPANDSSIPAPAALFGQDIRLADGNCASSAAARIEAGTVFLAAVDAGGNRSVEVSADFPDAGDPLGGGSCSTSGGWTSLAPALLALGTLLRRRR